MARTDNLSNFLTDVANAIRQKAETTAPIPAKDFDTQIRAIKKGIQLVNVDWETDDISERYNHYVKRGEFVGSCETLTHTPVVINSTAGIGASGLSGSLHKDNRFNISTSYNNLASFITVINNGKNNIAQEAFYSISGTSGSAQFQKIVTITNEVSVLVYNLYGSVWLRVSRVVNGQTTGTGNNIQITNTPGTCKGLDVHILSINKILVCYLVNKTIYTAIISIDENNYTATLLNQDYIMDWSIGVAAHEMDKVTSVLIPGNRYLVTFWFENSVPYYIVTTIDTINNKISNGGYNWYRSSSKMTSYGTPSALLTTVGKDFSSISIFLPVNGIAIYRYDFCLANNTRNITISSSTTTVAYKSGANFTEVVARNLGYNRFGIVYKDSASGKLYELYGEINRQAMNSYYYGNPLEITDCNTVGLDIIPINNSGATLTYPTIYAGVVRGCNGSNNWLCIDVVSSQNEGLASMSEETSARRSMLGIADADGSPGDSVDVWIPYSG